MDPLYLVRLAGIEPTTPWFVAKYSIQLSYSREKQDYSRGISGREEVKSTNIQRSIICSYQLHKRGLAFNIRLAGCVTACNGGQRDRAAHRFRLVAQHTVCATRQIDMTTT
ncbi:MAG: hypothetical protein JWP38_2239 [Herbaspirillum sp.]|jgi:hypothetical protein|nr:hypothetical protein [Herbaspirillum sp.]